MRREFNHANLCALLGTHNFMPHMRFVLNHVSRTWCARARTRALYLVRAALTRPCCIAWAELSWSEFVPCLSWIIFRVKSLSIVVFLCRVLTRLPVACLLKPSCQLRRQLPVPAWQGSYLATQRASPGKYAAIHGTAASRHFSASCGHQVHESTVRKFQ